MGTDGRIKRRDFTAVAALSLALPAGRAAAAAGGQPPERLNAPMSWPAEPGSKEMTLDVDVDKVLNPIERRIFGTNAEWFNDAGGLASVTGAARLTELAAAMGVSVVRFPGGILADYYRWQDGIGVPANRPVRNHPTDNGRSANTFGSPELFRLLRATRSEALLTVNAGTGTAEEAADWVAYCNRADDARRRADGFPDPIGVKLWEIGNELYLPGNPGEKKIGTTPQRYADVFLSFATAMRRVDPTITAIGIGVAPGPHAGPGSAYPEWSRVLLEKAAGELDQIAVHNAYFPILYKPGTPPLDVVYPALWSAPDAVEEDLRGLGALIDRHRGKRNIGIGVTEWGALFSLPNVDPYWTDHVKTLGSAVYVARMLQVLMSNPRVAVANHFKFTDRSFMGCVNYDMVPKLPFYALQMMAKESGTHRVEAQFDSMSSYDTEGVGTVPPRRGVADVTAIATRDQRTGRLFVNLVNRSVRRVHRVRLRLRGVSVKPIAEAVCLSGPEPTSSAGRDLPPEWPYSKAFEPYSSRPVDGPQRRAVNAVDAMVLPPFSVSTVILDDARPMR